MARKFLLGGRREQPPDAPEYERWRDRMVDRQIQRRGLTDPRVLAAVAEVPRHLFVPPKERDLSYDDHALPLGHGPHRVDGLCGQGLRSEGGRLGTRHLSLTRVAFPGKREAGWLTLSSRAGGLMAVGLLVVFIDVSDEGGVLEERREGLLRL